LGGVSAISANPAYQRIRADLMARIAGGEFDGTGRIPSEPILAREYGVSRLTVRHALDGLVQMGLVVRKQGVGTFTASGVRERRVGGLTSFSDDMRRYGELATVLLRSARISPGPEVSSALNLSPGALVSEITRLRLINNKPVAVLRSLIPTTACPDLVAQPLTNGSLWKTLETVHGIRLVGGEQRITPVRATREQAQLLEVRTGVPLLMIERTILRDGNVPIEWAQTFMHPDYPVVTQLDGRRERTADE
jgi:DNA-binding GntR family transcriptional regulator